MRRTDKDRIKQKLNITYIYNNSGKHIVETLPVIILN